MKHLTMGSVLFLLLCGGAIRAEAQGVASTFDQLAVLVQPGAKILNAVPDEPAVLLYAATNLTDHQLEQFTVTLFIFDAQGQLKARQLAPGRRTLDARSTKFSTMVLDVGAIGPTDILVVGVNQAQRADTEQWWRAELQSAAEAAAKRKLP